MNIGGDPLNYQSKIRLADLTLNVIDVKATADFYHRVIGLSVLELNDKEACLAIGDKCRLYLQKAKSQERVAGLYHLAILLPDRRALGNHLQHLLSQEVRLEGAADHGYSEAVYLADNEGNGIELYRDKSMSEWDFDEAGKPIGKTEVMDKQGVLDAADQAVNSFYKIPLTSNIGHLQFSVNNALKTSQDYQNVYELDNKMTIATASWIASGTYHHHFSFNHRNRNLGKRQEGQAGLAEAGIEIVDQVYFERIIDQANEKGWQLNDLEAGWQIIDDNGIALKLSLKDSISPI